MNQALNDLTHHSGPAPPLSYSRECLALIADPSLSGLRVAWELDSVIRPRGRPDTIVSDIGTELTLIAILRWC